MAHWYGCVMMHSYHRSSWRALQTLAVCLHIILAFFEEPTQVVSKDDFCMIHSLHATLFSHLFIPFHHYGYRSIDSLDATVTTVEAFVLAVYVHQIMSLPCYFCCSIIKHVYGYMIYSWPICMCLHAALEYAACWKANGICCVPLLQYSWLLIISCIYILVTICTRTPFTHLSSILCWICINGAWHGMVLIGLSSFRFSRMLRPLMQIARGRNLRKVHLTCAYHWWRIKIMISDNNRYFWDAW